MINKYIISKDKILYKAFPDLILLGDKMICIFSEMDEKNKVFNISYNYSFDRGVSWSESKIFVTKINDKGRWDSPRLCKMNDGSIIVVCPWYENHNHSNSYVYMWKCDKDLNIINEMKKTTITGIVPDKILEIDDKWIITTHERNINKRLETFIYYSYDKGITWTDKKILATDDKYNLCETSIIKVDSNTLVALMRENSSQGIDALKIISYDKGVTWSEIYKTPIPACHRPIITRLSSGRYLITYRFDQGRYKLKGMHGQNIFGCLCNKEDLLETNRDNMSTRIFPIDYDRSLNPNCGYTGVVEFEDGMIYVASFIIDDNPVGQIRGYSFYESDLIINNKI